MNIEAYTDMNPFTHAGIVTMNKLGYKYDVRPFRDGINFLKSVGERQVAALPMPMLFVIYVICFEDGSYLIEFDITARKLAEWNSRDFKTSPIPIVQFSQ